MGIQGSKLTGDREPVAPKNQLGQDALEMQNMHIHCVRTSKQGNLVYRQTIIIDVTQLVTLSTLRTSHHDGEWGIGSSGWQLLVEPNNGLNRIRTRS
jgi:hypothetical protein